MKHFPRLILVAVACGTFSALAAEKDTRAGSCADAKSQVEYFCRSNPSDTMVTIGTACTNAKKNMAAACEGKTEPDPTYKFDEHGRVAPKSK